MTCPAPSTNADAAQALHGAGLAGAAYHGALAARFGQMFAGFDIGPSAMLHARDVIERMAPRDPAEEMLVAQLLLAHARVLHLSALANQQTDLDNLRTVHEYADKASNTFRRLMLALAEYRRPPKAGAHPSPRSSRPTSRPSRSSTPEQPWMKTRRTNRDATPRRRYRLIQEGLASLRASIRRVAPWEHSTGPRTPEGEARSRMNAWKHGERSAATVAMRQECAALLRRSAERRPRTTPAGSGLRSI